MKAQRKRSDEVVSEISVEKFLAIANCQWQQLSTGSRSEDNRIRFKRIWSLSGRWRQDNIVQAAYDNVLQNRCIMQQHEQRQRQRQLQQSCINYLQWPKISRQAAGERKRRSGRHGRGQEDYKLNCQVQVGTMQRHTHIHTHMDRYADTAWTSTKEKGAQSRSRRELAANCALNCGSLCGMVTELNHRLHFCFIVGQRGRHMGAGIAKPFTIFGPTMPGCLAKWHLKKKKQNTTVGQAAQLPVYPVELAAFSHLILLSCKPFSATSCPQGIKTGKSFMAAKSMASVWLAECCTFSANTHSRTLPQNICKVCHSILWLAI